MTNQVEKLLAELNKSARKKLRKPRKSTFLLDAARECEQPPLHPNCPSCFREPTTFSEELIQDIVRTMLKSAWPWSVCKAAFPHDIDAAMRLYRKIHGEDPPHLRMEP